MIIFRNPGLVDLTAITTMGVNVKVGDNPFGYFGTGFKFALATILRGGGTIKLFRGTEEICFATEDATVRHKVFKIVLVGEADGDHWHWTPMNITTELGRNWEPWMVLRELGCNALDEGGGFFSGADDGQGWSEGETTIIVDWPELDEAWKKAGEIFFDYGDRHIRAVTGKLQVAEGQSDFIFYRGIRALKLERPSALTYNILAPMALSEDRQLSRHWEVDQVTRQFWMGCEHKALLEMALLAGNGAYESHLRFEQDGSQPLSRQFIEVCLDARDSRNSALSSHARQAMQKQLRSAAEEERFYGGSSGGRFSDVFGRTLKVIGELIDYAPGMPDNWEEELKSLDQLQFVPTPDEDAPDQPLVFEENERLYVKRSAFKLAPHEIAYPLLQAILSRLSWQIDRQELLCRALLQRDHLTSQRWGEPAEPEPAPEEDPTLTPEPINS